MLISEKIFHQTLACSSVIGLQLMIGTFCGWMAPIMAKLNEGDSEFRISLEQESWFGSAQDIGRVVGPFVSFVLVDNLGRRRTLVLVAVTYFVAWTGTIFTRDIYTLCALRVLFGVGNSVNDVVSGIYTTENCSPHFRGIVSSMVFFVFYAATLVECVIATYLSYTCTAILNTVLAGCVFSTLYFCVETPYFLAMKGERGKAMENLVWLSGGGCGGMAEEELRKIERSIEAEKLKRRSFKTFFSSMANVKGILLVVSMSVLGTATGPNALSVYASFVFSASETLTTYEYTILYGVVQFFAVTVSPFIIEKMNRRSLVVGGYVGVTFSQMCSYLLRYLRGRGCEIAFYPWLIFASAASFCVCNALKTPAEYVLRGELLPFSVRAVGSSMAVAGFSITSFCLSKSFLPIATRFGLETNFLLYSVTGCVASIFFYVALPETRGKTLHELHQNGHGGSVKTADKHSREEVA